MGASRHLLEEILLRGKVGCFDLLLLMCWPGIEPWSPSWGEHSTGARLLLQQLFVFSFRFSFSSEFNNST